MKTSKRGISLIVLVITIIVMIILATAIILSLNSSNISGKASEAKLTSDLANKKEAASVYVSEYELKVAKGKIDKATTTADDYVKAEMKKAGIDTSDVAVQDDGTILVGIAAMFENNNIEIGTVVKGYTPTGTDTYKTSGNENIEEEIQTINRATELVWKYMGVDENGNTLIVADSTGTLTSIYISWKGGYLYGPTELNNACKALYSSNMGIARSIDINDVTRVLEYDGHKGMYYKADFTQVMTDKIYTMKELETIEGVELNVDSLPDEIDISNLDCDAMSISINSEDINANVGAKELIFQTSEYWLASACAHAAFAGPSVVCDMYAVHSSGVASNVMFFSDSGQYGLNIAYCIRPVVELNPSVQMTYDGTTVTLK